MYSSYPYLLRVILYINLVNANVCKKVAIRRIFDTTVFCIISDAISIAVIVTYDNFFFIFLSFFLNIGTATVSAGAYLDIAYIPNVQTKTVAMYCTGLSKTKC